MDSDIKDIVIRVVMGIFTILVALFLVGGIRTVKTGEVGLKVRFGKIVDTEIHEGLHFKLPIIEKIQKINVKVQKVELNAESSTKDMQLVGLKVAVNYRVDSKKAAQLYKNIGKKYVDVALTPAIQESVKTAIAQYDAEEITVKRDDVSQRCLKAIQDKVKKYGIIVETFNLTDFTFSQEYTKAIEEKQVAQQKVETSKQELEREKIEAEKKIVKAEAERKANDLKKQTLTDNIIKEKLIEKWNGELPKATGGNSIFDIDGLMK